MLPHLQAMSGPIKNGYRVPTGPTSQSILTPFEMPKGHDAVINVLVDAFRGVGQIASAKG